MANVGIFLLTRTEQEALDFLNGEHLQDPEVLLTLKYSCALFWLALFSPDDEKTIQEEASWVDEESALRFSAYVTSIPVAIERLKARKGVVLSLLPAAASDTYSGFYDEWASFIGRHQGYAALNPVEVTSLADSAESEATLRKAITIIAEARIGDASRAWAAFDTKSVVMPLSLAFRAEGAAETALLWRQLLAGGDVTGWPPPPSQSEIRFATPKRRTPMQRAVDWLVLVAHRINKLF